MLLKELFEKEKLDAEQLDAAKSEENCVVSAGAGSGKTKTLAARFVWLVVEKKIPLDKIIAITFTNKAAAEMYDRIYKFLACLDETEAKQAIAHFYQAQISTIDSFCAQIARTASRYYGVSSDFTNDDHGLKQYAQEEALTFVLRHRDDAELSGLICDNNIRTIADELFAKSVLQYASIASPFVPADTLALQKTKLQEGYKVLYNCLAGNTKLLFQYYREVPADCSLAYYQAIKPAFQRDMIPLLPENIGLFFSDDADAEKTAAKNSLAAALKDYTDFFDKFCAVPRNLAHAKDENVKNICAMEKTFKDIQTQYSSLTGTILQWPALKKLYALLDEFQEIMNQRKRATSTLNFKDVADMAVDVLTRPDIQHYFQARCSSIMIDEFQDNNELQRELVYAVSGGKNMFFVGDGKQSIYRFRGADVKVFHKLEASLETKKLNTNYRSCAALVEAFNYIFEKLLPGDNEQAGSAGCASGAKDYEARFGGRILAGKGPDTEQKRLHFFLVKQDDINDLASEDALGGPENEAFFIARKIKELKNEKAYSYGDFAILQKTYTNQRYLESWLRQFGVPYLSERPAGLFQDAPLNDISNLLRLAVYPGDKLSYAALLRSPLCRISDAGLAALLMQGYPKAETILPFDPAREEVLSPADRENYRQGRELYEKLCADSQVKSNAELLSEIWYKAGYRYETLAARDGGNYASLYNLFYELARQADQRGDSLAGFVDFIEDFSTSGKYEDENVDLEVSGEEDESGAVKLLSIHKAKGLEWPVVFIYDGAHRSQAQRKDVMTFYDRENGLSINIADENFFFLQAKEQNEKEEEAELKRLLYVAMTRAEQELYFTATVPKTSSGKLKSFLSLLQEKGLLDGADDAPCFDTHPLKAMTRSEALSSASAAQARQNAKGQTIFAREREAAACYKAAHVIEKAKPIMEIKNASALDKGIADSAAPDNNAPDDELALLLKRADLSPAEFGTIVHSFIEARFINERPALPSEVESKIVMQYSRDIEEKALEMAGRFFASRLGMAAAAAKKRQVEFPLVYFDNSDGVKRIINGKVDLFFEQENEATHESEICLVDYKTDRDINPDKHRTQLDIYSKALAAIYHKTVRPWLFYLRYGEERALS
jgi:ATP-dependent helicase/nuclease subunit A